ncbi:MAG TPA: hypothetical protein VFM53_09135 [Anaeromyxobacteraceae bacterium]|nr:hypothetical protein [Anaeromyxobacteraceae bacterium]
MAATAEQVDAWVLRYLSSAPMPVASAPPVRASPAEAAPPLRSVARIRLVRQRRAHGVESIAGATAAGG